MKTDYDRLAEVFGELNAGEEPIAQAGPMSDEERKLKYYWESCQPAGIDASGIIRRTQQQIRRTESRRLTLRRWRIAASAAAVVALCLTTFGLLHNSLTPTTDYLARLDKLDVTLVEQVTLVTPDGPVALSSDASIRYTAEGDIFADGKQLAVQSAECYDQLLVPAGRQAHVVLADGTCLTVNAQSKLSFPRTFTGDTRRIYAEGEVFLDVARDKQHPFVVTSGAFELRVLGTKFNISSYDSRGVSNIVLVEGLVEVTDKQERRAVLSPNDLLCITDGAITWQEKVDVSEYISWVDGVLLLNGSNLETIVGKLGIYYGVDIRCDDDVAREKVYGKLNLRDNLHSVLSSLQQTTPLRVENNGTGYYLGRVKNQ